MELTMRKYANEADYWKIRAFLREVMILNDCTEKSWHVARLDYWRWHVVGNNDAFPWIEDVIYLWETEEKELAAVLTPEGKGEFFLQLHPAFSSPSLRSEIIAVGEAHFPVTNKEGKRCVVCVD